MLTLSAFSHVNHCFCRRRTRLGRVCRHGVRTRRHGSRGLDHHHPKVHLWQCFSPVVRLMVQKSGIHQLRLVVFPMFIPLSTCFFLTSQVACRQILQSNSIFRTFDVSKFPIKHLLFEHVYKHIPIFRHHFSKCHKLDMCSKLLRIESNELARKNNRNRKKTSKK